MEDQSNKRSVDEVRNDVWSRFDKENQRGKIIGGFILICIGLLLMAREAGMYIPVWLFSWPMFLIVVGIFLGIKHSFRNMAWMILVLIGGLFLVRQNFPLFEYRNYIWPVVIILAGLFIMVKPSPRWRRSFRQMRRHQPLYSRESITGNSAWDSDEEYIDAVAVFGSVKKNVISKNFKGGEVSAVFGGAELNLMQADIQGRVELEVNQVFGGTKLIVPSHWEIKSEIAAVLGSVEDKRPIRSAASVDEQKVLILRGSTVFGGIDIKSY
jgi:predicted membrane protein